MLKVYEDLSWLGKILYKLRMRRVLKKINKTQFKTMIQVQTWLENHPREEVERRWELL